MSSTHAKIPFWEKGNIVTDTFRETFHTHPNLARLTKLFQTKTSVLKHPKKKLSLNKWVKANKEISNKKYSQIVKRFPA